MRTFIRVVERRSFADAARDLMLARSRVTDQVQQLEKHLGVRLLTRTTRHVATTPEGDEYYGRCVRILAEIDDAEDAVSHTVPAGPLRIDVHGTMARHFLLPFLPQFLESYPGIKMFVGESDRFVDLVGEGVDCVIRVGEPEVSGLIGRKLGNLEEGTFASRGYLNSHGVPLTPDDLDNHRMVGFVSSKTRSVVPLEFQVGNTVRRVTLPVSVAVNAAETMCSLALHDMGLIQVPRYRLSDQLSSGEIVEILQDFPPTPMPVYLLFPEGRRLSARARVFIDWATETLTARLQNHGSQPGN